MSEPGHSPNKSADKRHPDANAADRPADRCGQPEDTAAGTVGKTGASAREIGGPAGLEPTRYGDWEHKGRCIDF